MSRTSFALLKERLSGELVEVAARVRATGEAPTAETAPLLMRLWTAARNKLGKDAHSHGNDAMYFHGARLQIFSLWGNHGFLRKFYLRDYITGDLLLIGDPWGPDVAALVDAKQKELT